MHIRRALAVICAALSLLVVGAVPSSAATTGSAWRDDFNSFNGQNWRVVTSACHSARNVSVSNGILRLKTVAGSSSACPLIGARVDTYDRRTFAPGTYTARIMFQPRTGSWQTFWLTGASGRAFPSNGEVDLAEILGRESTVHHLRLHSAYVFDASSRCTQQADPVRPAGFFSQWHTYSVTTSATRATFQVDGQTVASFTPNSVCTWPFTDPMRAIFSSDGGTWAGPPNKALFPVTMSVDWFSYRP
jgi:beta-glucanase (GH16 family)